MPDQAPERTLFEKIIAGEIPAEVVYEDEVAFAFKDISPQAPVHVLIVPKRVIRRVGEAVKFGLGPVVGPQSGEPIGGLARCGTVRQALRAAFSSSAGRAAA